MSFSQAQDRFRRAGRNPTRGRATGFGENAAAAFDQFVEGQQSISMALNVDQEIDRISQRVKEVTGQDVEPSLGEQVFGPGRNLTSVPPEFLERIRKAREENPDALGDIPTTEEGIFERIRQEVQASEKEFRDISSRATTLGDIGGFVGTTGAATIDPPVLASLPFGAARGAGILRTALTEAGIGAATEVPVQAVVQSQRSRLGLESGVERAIENIAAAGIGGGIIGAAGRALGRGVEKIGSNRFQDAEQARQAFSRETRRQNPVLDDAIRTIEREREIRARNPFPDDVPGSERVFRRVFDETLKTIREEGRAPRVSTNLPVRDEVIGPARDIGNIVEDTRRTLDDDIVNRVAELGNLSRQQQRVKNQREAVRAQVGREFARSPRPEGVADALQRAARIDPQVRAAIQRRREANRSGAGRGKQAAATRAENEARAAAQREFPDAEPDEIENLVRNDTPVQDALETVRQTGRQNIERFSPPDLAADLQGFARPEVDTGSSKAASRAAQEKREAERILQDEQTQVDRLRQFVEDDMDGNAQVRTVDEQGDVVTTTPRAILDDLDRERTLFDEIQACLGGRGRQ